MQERSVSLTSTAPRWRSQRWILGGSGRSCATSVSACSPPVDNPSAGAALAQHLTIMDGLCEHFLDAYTEQANVSRERVLLWETCDLITAMLHAWTKVRLARIHPRLTVLKHHLQKHSIPN